MNEHHSLTRGSERTVEERLDALQASERQAALRSLLSQPMLSARGSSAHQFGLVRRHADWLRQWITNNCGWRLHLDSEFARLQKTPPDVLDGTRGAVESKSQSPFSRRKYVLLCLALATLERGDRQTTLGSLAKEVIALISADAAIAGAGITFDLENRDHRGDLVHAVRYLLDIRVLEHVDGDEHEFLKNTSDVLYNVNRAILALMLNVRRGPSAVAPDLTLQARMQTLIEEQRPDTDDARNRELRFRVMRRLLDDPVVYFDDLEASEMDYLNRQRGRLLRRIEEATGLIAEIRAEGIAMLDDRGDATDLEMPKDGTEGHFTLLIAEFLAQQVRERHSSRVGVGQLQEHASALIQEHSSHWRKSVHEPGAEESLVADALQRLEGLRLIARDGEFVIPRPAIARYGIGAICDGTPGSAETPSLFQD
ncbi:MAG TPA: TIGR02678 family protein [Pirellulales bacterium]|nr:TIGR02678 family protein [Pirellulales bacterium]